MRSIFTPRFTRAWIANFFSDLSFSLFVHFPGFLAGLGVGETIIGATASVAAITAILVRPRAGSWMDQFGRIPVVRIAAVIRIVATLAFLFVDGMGPMVFVIRAVHLSTLAIVFTGLFTYAADVIPAERRAQGIALYGLSGMVAVSFGPLIGDPLVASFGYKAIFAGMAVAETGLLVVLFTLRAVENRSELAVPGGSLDLLRFRPLVPIWVMMTGFGLGFGILLNFIRTFVDAADIGRVGPFFTAYSVAAIVVRLAFSWIPDRLGEKRTLYPAVALFAIGTGSLAFADSTTSLLLSAAAAGMGHAFIFPALTSLVVLRSPSDRRGSAMSLFTAMFDLGPLIGAPILGAVAETFGYTTMWLTVGTTIVVVGGAFALLDRVFGAPPIPAR